LNKAVVFVVGIISISIVSVVATACGHDSVLVTGATSAIVGLCTGFGFYYKGKVAGARGVVSDVLKNTEKSVTKLP